MKNLKRVLSLALTGVMLVGMMAVGASAVNAEDFTDHDEITHTEAVSIATALKIIDGKDDGSFDPNGLVTRGQMAKMITRARYGGEDPVLGVKTTPSFTDIKGRWDESYIEYCYSAGIINGRGDGTFDPDGNVTGTEAAKMLLTALGYDASVFDLTGADWDINTNRWANEKDADLYDNLKGIDPNAAATRDQVAQMIYNAINAKTKDLVPSKNTNGVIEWTYENGATMLWKNYGAIRVEGVVTNNEFTDNSDAQKGKTTLDISNTDEIAELVGAPTNPNFAVSSGANVFGRAVILYVKPAASNQKNMSKAEVISDVIYDVDTNTEKTTTADKKFTDWAKDQGLKFDLFDGDGDGSKDEYATFYTNYANVTNVNASPAAYGDVDSATGKVYNAKNPKGTELTYIDNDGDGIVNVVLQNVWEFGQVSKYSTKDDGSVTVKTDGTRALVPSNEELKNIVAYEDIAVDDFVNVTKVDDTYYIEKAESITGDLDSYEDDAEAGSAKNLTVDGEKYNVTQTSTAYTTGNDLKALGDIAKRSVLTEEVTIYLDKYGYAVAGDTAAASDWLFVANAAVNNTAQTKDGGALTAYVYFEDGTSGSYVVNKYTATGAATAKDNNFSSAVDVPALMGKLFKYSFNSKDELVLEGADATTDADHDTQNEITVADGTKGIVYDRDRSKLTVQATAGTTVSSDPVKYVTMDTAVFFVTLKADGSIDKVNVYNEKTAPSMNYATGSGSNKLHDGSNFICGATYVTTPKSTYDLDAVVFTSTSAVGSDWLFVIDYVKSVDGGRVYNAIVDGELVQIETTDTTGYSRKENTAYSYSMDGDKFDLDATAYDSSLVAVGEVTLVDRKSIIVKDTGTGIESKITSSTLTALIDSDDTEVDVKVAVGDVVYVIYNESKEAEAIFVLEEYDDTNNSIVYINDLVTDKGSKTYEVSLGDLTTALGAAPAASDVKNLFVTSGKAKVYLVDTAPASTDKVEDLTTTDSTTTPASSGAGSTYSLVVVAEGAEDSSKDYTVYTINIKA